MKKSLLIILATVLSLMACLNQTETTWSVTPVLDGTTQTPSFDPSLPFLPTKTPRPISTITNTPEQSPTIPYSTIAAKTTLDSIAEAFLELGSSYWKGSISPSGAWAAIAIYREEGNVLKLVETKGEKNWAVNFYDIYGSRYDYVDQSVGSVSTAYWSKDGNYVYLEPHPEWDGPGLWFGSGTTLIRFNLKNGTWADLNVGNSWSISPNEKYIAYSANNGIHLRTFFDGSEKTFSIPEKFENFGRFVWSPENDKFAFTAAYGDWYDGKTGFSVFIIDLKDSSMEILLEDDLRMFYPQKWVEASKIILHQYQHDNVYYFDLMTKEITPVTSP